MTQVKMYSILSMFVCLRMQVLWAVKSLARPTGCPVSNGINIRLDVEEVTTKCLCYWVFCACLYTMLFFIKVRHKVQTQLTCRPLTTMTYLYVVVRPTMRFPSIILLIKFSLVDIVWVLCGHDSLRDLVKIYKT